VIPWRVAFAPSAWKDLERLQKYERDSVQRSIERLAQDPTSVDVKKLKAARELWRMRVGRLRVRFRFLRDTRTIEVLRILPRGKAYDNL